MIVRKVISTSLLFAASLIFCLDTSAQPTNQVRAAAPTRNEIGTSRMLSRSLNLTDAQVRSLEPVFKEQQARMSALRTNNALSRQERMAQIQAIRKGADEKVKPHLTAEQLEKWQQMRSGPATLSYDRATNRFSFPPARKSEPEKVERPPSNPSSNTNAPSVSQEVK